MKYYTLSETEIFAMASEREVAIAYMETCEMPVVQWKKITPDKPIPKPENERQVLVLGSKTGNEAEATTTIGASKNYRWTGIDLHPEYISQFTHYCILQTPPLP